MSKYLLILFLVCPLSMSYADYDYDYDGTGVFFCTTDLSPDVYGRLQQMYKHGADAAIISSTLSVASLGSYAIYKKHPIIGGGIILAAGVGALKATYVSSSYFSKLFKSIKEKMSDSLTSSSSLSNPNQRYVSIQKTSFSDDENEISSYKHCSILTAEYASVDNDFVVVGDAEVKSFVQDGHRSKTKLEKAGYSAPATISSDGLQHGTVCTLVKSYPLEDYRIVKASTDNSFYKKKRETKYNVLSNNCCTAAYDYVKEIDGDLTVIDELTFNHGIGIKSRSIPSLVKNAGKHVLSFFVGEKSHLEELEKKIEEESEIQSTEEDQADEL